jgi:HK97 family phage major capsid protein
METKEYISSLDDDSSIKDFKDALTAMHGDAMYMNEKIQDILQASVRAPDESTRQSKTFYSDVLRAIYRKNYSAFEKLGFQPVSNTSMGDWKSSTWNIGEKAALGTPLRGDTTTGSYLVPTGYADEVLRLAKQASVMMGRVRRIPMGVRSIRYPDINTEPTMTWVTDESTVKTESGPTFGYKTLECETCAAWLAVTDELVEDSVVDLGEFFMQLFAEAWGAEFDRCVLAGNNDPFYGILYDSNVNETTMGAGKTSFDNVTVDNLIDMQSAITRERAHVDAVYIMNRYVFNILRKLKDDNGNPIYQGPAEQVPATILGVPYILSEQMPGSADDGVSTPFLIYGNPRYYMNGDRVGLEWKVYDKTVRNLDYDEIFFRIRLRQAFLCAVPTAFSRLKTAAS